MHAHMTRRAALLGLASAISVGRSSLAMAAAPTDRRFVVIILRGALDGLSALVPYGDPTLASLRGALIPPAPGLEGGLGDLGGYASQSNEVQELVQYLDCPTVLGNYDEGVGFNKDSCGCNYVKPFDIQMSDISFFWTREHTTDVNKAWLRELPREIRLDVEGQRVLLLHQGTLGTVLTEVHGRRAERCSRRHHCLRAHPCSLPPSRGQRPFRQHRQRRQAQRRRPACRVLRPDDRWWQRNDRADPPAL